MPYRTAAAYTKAGIVDDASPNASAPAAAAELVLPPFEPASGEQAKGWVYYLRFLTAAGVEVADGTATVTLWVKDEKDKSWASVDSDTLVGNRELYQLQHFFPGATLFAQLTDIAGTAVASVETRLGSF